MKGDSPALPVAPILLTQTSAVTWNQKNKSLHTFLFQTHANQSRRRTATGEEKEVGLGTFGACGGVTD